MLGRYFGQFHWNPKVECFASDTERSSNYWQTGKLENNWWEKVSDTGCIIFSNNWWKNFLTYWASNTKNTWIVIFFILNIFIEMASLWKRPVHSFWGVFSPICHMIIDHVNQFHDKKSPKCLQVGRKGRGRGKQKRGKALTIHFPPSENSCLGNRQTKLWSHRQMYYVRGIFSHQQKLRQALKGNILVVLPFRLSLNTST